MNFRLFLSVLLVYRSNFHMLHWQAAGVEFHMMHDKSAEYYDKLLDDADIIAEIAMRLGQNPVNYVEALELLEQYEDHGFKILPSDTTYSTEDFVENTDIMFNDILVCIEGLLESEEIQSVSNTGIRSSLETMHDYYDLQANYINKHRKG